MAFMLTIDVILSCVGVFGFMEFQISDQIAIYQVSYNINLFTACTLCPMLGITLFSYCTWEMRYYEMIDEDIVFDSTNSGLVDPDYLSLQQAKPSLKASNPAID